MMTVLGFYVDASAQEKIQYAPRLVVNITIDQLRTDYLEAFSPLYGQEGLKRLLKEGLVYENAYYPFTGMDRERFRSSRRSPSSGSRGTRRRAPRRGPCRPLF